MFKSLSSLFKDIQPQNRSGHVKEASSLPRKKNSPEGGMNFIKLIEEWPSIVGEKLSSHTIPLKNQNGVLYVLSNHPAFAEQLSFMEEIIKKKIFQAFPSFSSCISKICFQTNSSFFEKQKATLGKKTPNKTSASESVGLHPLSPEYKKLKKAADEEFSAISDPEIQEILTSLFIQDRHQKNTRT